MFYDRYVLNKWVDSEGAVFSITTDNVLTREEIVNKWNTFPENMHWTFYRGIDWGGSSPTSVVWGAQHKVTKDILIYREWRKIHADADECPLAINAFTQSEKVKMTWIDHSEIQQKLLTRNNIRSRFAPKGAGSVLNGILIANSLLRRAQNGQDGGLYFYDNLRCNNDSHPDAKEFKKNVIEEMQSLLYDSKKDRPQDDNDHGWDATKYMLLGMFDKKQSYYVSPTEMRG